MSLRNLFLIKSPILLFIVYVLLLSCTTPSPPSPNIILIMADDLGYGDIGCYGSKTIQTPAIDRLAAEGLKFTDYHSNGAVCTPTRAALMTGRYQQRAGLEGVIYVQGETRQTGMSTDETTIAEVFKNAGYVTGIMGKWHLGYKKQYNPVHHGFNQFYGYVSGNVDYHSHYDNAGIYDWWHNLDTIRQEGYVTDLITDQAVDFIRNNRENTFFLYVPHEAPHVPFQGPNDSAFRYSDREFSYLGPVEDTDRAYIEMVEVMDEGIGKIVQTLEEQGLENNTFVLFCSDNGARFGSNGKLRGAKGSLWEGGHRVPAVAWYPEKIEAGTVTDATVMSMDLLPSLASVAGIVPEGEFDGIDVSGVLYNGENLEERPLFWRYRKQKAVRKGDWKYLKNEGTEYLFNLKDDISEENNIKEEFPEIFHSLKTQLNDWENKMNQYKQLTN